jgi:hypothetical protein
MYAGCPIVIGYAAEAQLLAGRLPEARGRVEEALAMGVRIGDRVYIPDLHVLSARIALASGDADGARAAIVAALAEARAQKALWPELAALLEQCALPGAGKAARAELAAHVAQLAEGADTALMQRARRLLG